MKADALARLRSIARGEAVTPVTRTVTPKTRGVTPVTPLRIENDGSGNDTPEVGVGSLPDHADADAIEERAGLAAGRIPSVYLDAWARLNGQKPVSTSEVQWRLTLDDGGRFLDDWGREAADMGWTPGELFDVRAGLTRHLGGKHVETVGADRVKLSDGRTIMRRTLVERREAEVQR